MHVTWLMEEEPSARPGDRELLDKVQVGSRNGGARAHGRSVGLTYARIHEYYFRTKEIVTFLEKRFA